MDSPVRSKKVLFLKKRENKTDVNHAAGVNGSMKSRLWETFVQFSIRTINQSGAADFWCHLKAPHCYLIINIIGLLGFSANHD